MRCTRCPRCDGREVGRISSERYYCWGCCCEFQAARSGVADARVGQEDEDAAAWRIFDVDEEGSLVPVAAMPAGPGQPAEPDGPAAAEPDGPVAAGPPTGADQPPAPPVPVLPPAAARGATPRSTAVPGLG